MIIISMYLHRNSLKLFYFTLVFFFNDTATTEIYTLSLHDALPICSGPADCRACRRRTVRQSLRRADRKSTRLNSSHANISYAVFCLKKKKKKGEAKFRKKTTLIRRYGEAVVVMAFYEK